MSRFAPMNPKGSEYTTGHVLVIAARDEQIGAHYTVLLLYVCDFPF